MISWAFFYLLNFYATRNPTAQSSKNRTWCIRFILMWCTWQTAAQLTSVCLWWETLIASGETSKHAQITKLLHYSDFRSGATKWDISQGRILHFSPVVYGNKSTVILHFSAVTSQRESPPVQILLRPSFHVFAKSWLGFLWAHPPTVQMHKCLSRLETRNQPGCECVCVMWRIWYFHLKCTSNTYQKTPVA